MLAGGRALCLLGRLFPRHFEMSLCYYDILTVVAPKLNVQYEFLCVSYVRSTCPSELERGANGATGLFNCCPIALTLAIFEPAAQVEASSRWRLR